MPLHQLKTITLLHEELEALRLFDLEGHYQEQAAQQMNVSRSSLQRIVGEAPYKVVQALTEGTALHIEGGTFRVANWYWQCKDCGHLWKIEHGSRQNRPIDCPVCHSHSIRLRRNQRHQTKGQKTSRFS